MRHDDHVEVGVSGDVAARLRAAGCVFAEDEARLLTEAAGGSAVELERLVSQRVSGTPLEHLLGWAEFRGVRVAVGPGVFVPRQRSVFLVDEALALVRHSMRALGEDAPSATATRPGTPASHTTATRTPHTTAAPSGTEAFLDGAARSGPQPNRPVIVDLCCGSGALGLALTTALAGQDIPVDLHAADIEPVAVACARRNLAPIGGSVYEGDLFTPLPHHLRGRVDILLANTPYVPTAHIADMPPEARDHEPRSALDGGPDGLDLFRRVAAEAPHWLAPGGHLLVETSTEQAPTATAILTTHGLTPRLAESEEHYATVVIGTCPE
ncbi:release factor glutamine methyltransferase [Nocardia puris]|uniref:Release factor glutamine methyltransferase n=1 Tax=Nocardia puris TaxID=208602 RepID=A0A366DWH7_9NOCA|nr:release factor glutamine methyltransferase [Nocardia puris]